MVTSFLCECLLPASLPSNSNRKRSSWESALSVISNELDIGNNPQSTIRKFLADPEVLTLLSAPWTAFPASSPQTKQLFETRTSAINATPSSTAHYDIKELKDDALWLSKKVDIDEVSALRIVVGECQSREYAQLSGPVSEEELASIRESAGESKYSSPIPVALLSRGADAETIKKEFGTVESRHNRILHTYLVERRSLIKCTEQLLDACFATPEPASGNAKGKDAQAAAIWAAECGRAIVTKVGLAASDRLVINGIDFIESKIKGIENGSGWPNGENDDGIELEWIQTQIAEATHAMEIIWHFLVHSTGFPSSDIVLAWFQLQSSFGFFNTFSMVSYQINTYV